MDRYIGLDGHTQSCTLAIVSGTGKRLRELVVDTSAEALIEALKLVPGRKHLCMETGNHSEWLYEVLEPFVEEIVVVNPEGAAGNKSDSIDAYQLAEDLRTGRIRSRVFQPTQNFSGLRAAIRVHRMVVRDMVRTKNRLQLLFQSRGLRGAGKDLYKPETRTAWLARLPESQRHMGELLGEQLNGQLVVARKAVKLLKSASEPHPAVALVATCPGIGVVRAAQLVGAVVEPHRFRTKRQFWSYSGLAVVTRSSSDWVHSGHGWVRKTRNQTRGLNRNSKPLLKEIFKGAAITVISQLPEHPLHLGYRTRVEGGMAPSMARLTLARQIAAITLAMWKGNTTYSIERSPSLGSP